MSLAALMNRACTVTHITDDGPPDEYGDPTEQTTTTSTVCYCEQRNASEDTVNADTQAEDWLVMLPAATAVDGNDRVTVGSLVLEVQGPPWPAYNPRTAAVSHIELIGRQVK